MFCFVLALKRWNMFNAWIAVCQWSRIVLQSSSDVVYFLHCFRQCNDQVRWIWALYRWVRVGSGWVIWNHNRIALWIEHTVTLLKCCVSVCGTASCVGAFCNKGSKLTCYYKLHHPSTWHCDRRCCVCFDIRPQNLVGFFELDLLSVFFLDTHYNSLTSLLYGP